MIKILFYLVSAFVGIYINVWYMLLILENKSKLLSRKDAKKFPKVSVLIPARNEEKTIGDALKSVLSMNYPKDKLEVIAIDNGSTDKTSEVISRFKGVKLLFEKKLGKANALNKGLPLATGDIIGTLDADTLVDKNCLKRSIGYFEDKKVGAVTNFVKADSEKGILGKFQTVEYAFSGITKKLISFLDSMYITPGTLSLLRRDAIKDIKFSDDTLAEDMDMALSIKKKGYKIVNSLDAISYTRIPMGFRNLAKQRIRWYRGFIENTIKHADLMLNRKFTHLGFFIFPMAYITILIGIGFLSIVLSDYFNSLQLLIKSLFYIPIEEQASLVLGSIPRLETLLLSPYSLISFVFIFSTSFVLLLYSLRILSLARKRDIALLPFYMLGYYFLIMLLWCFALFMELFRFKKRW